MLDHSPLNYLNESDKCNCLLNRFAIRRGIAIYFNPNLSFNNFAFLRSATNHDEEAHLTDRFIMKNVSKKKNPSVWEDQFRLTTFSIQFSLDTVF